MATAASYWKPSHPATQRLLLSPLYGYAGHPSCYRWTPTARAGDDAPAHTESRLSPFSNYASPRDAQNRRPIERCVAVAHEKAASPYRVAAIGGEVVGAVVHSPSFRFYPVPLVRFARQLLVEFDGSAARWSDNTTPSVQTVAHNLAIGQLDRGRPSDFIRIFFCGLFAQIGTIPEVAQTSHGMPPISIN